MIHDYMVGNCSCTGHIKQNQMFEMLIGELVKVNFVVNLKPEKVLFYGIKRPVLFLQLKSGLELYNCNIDWDTKRNIGADNRSHQPFGVFLKMFAETDNVGFGYLPTMTVKVTFRNCDFNSMFMQTEFLFILVLLVVAWLLKHTFKHLAFPGMVTEIYRIAVIVLKETFDVRLYRNCDIEFHR